MFFDCPLARRAADPAGAVPAAAPHPAALPAVPAVPAQPARCPCPSAPWPSSPRASPLSRPPACPWPASRPGRCEQRSPDAQPCLSCRPQVAPAPRPVLLAAAQPAAPWHACQQAGHATRACPASPSHPQPARQLTRRQRLLPLAAHSAPSCLPGSPWAGPGGGCRQGGGSSAGACRGGRRGLPGGAAGQGPGRLGGRHLLGQER